ncbi:MAG TPA: hypothetical protein PLN24_04295 [Victivallales bacterium]|nr:hypothetical protein [Victivallales bacterium]HPO91494.1 hypothetical protein [Victivallales bacterium]
MKKILTFTVLLIYCFIAKTEDFQQNRKVQLKEGARTILFLPSVSTFLVHDPEIISVAKTESPDELIIIGLKMGNAVISCQNMDRTITTINVCVVPKYWDTLEALFENNPNIRMTVTGEHLILSGEVNDQDSMSRVKTAQELDKKRIINNVTFSKQNLLEKINSYLKNSGLNDVFAKIDDKVVYLRGMLLDKDKEKDLISVVKSLADSFSCSVNTSGLKTGGPPLIVEVKFVNVARGKDNNMGLLMDDIKYNLNWNPKEVDVWQFENHTRSRQETGSWELDGEVTNSGSVKLQKIKSSLKVLYEARMSTMSGEKVKLQRGGAIYLQTSGVQVADVQTVDYGFIVEIVPTILSPNSISADVSVQVSGLQNSNPLTINKYTTNAKYVISPGEIIVLNKMNVINDKLAKQGVPFLSEIPVLGYMFENTQENNDDSNVLLLLRISAFEPDVIAEEGRDSNEKFKKIKKSDHSEIIDSVNPLNSAEDEIEKRVGVE